jgi:hypothetical protein
VEEVEEGTPNAIMAQTGTEKNKIYLFSFLSFFSIKAAI